jgi:type I restriction enzyme R subunit
MSDMTLNEAIVEEVALGWFQELGYAVLPGPQMATGEPAAERESFGDVVLVGRLCEAIRRINPASSMASPTTVAQPATVQSSSRLNP